LNNHLKGLLIAFFGIVILTPDAVLVRLADADRQSGCNSCSSKSACGTGVLSDLFSGFSLFKRPLQKGVKAGDTITLEISSKELFFRASQLYLMPLLALFVGAYLSNLIFPSNDIVQTLVGLSSLAASLVLLRFLIR